MTQAPPAIIGPWEDLGRGVFSSKHADRARRSRTPHRVFLTEPGQPNISVDRLSTAPLPDTVAIGDNVAAARSATFYGWAAVTFERASANGRRVVPAPLIDNPFHANIVLPVPAAEDREEQKRHAQELADASRWRKRP